MTVLYTVLRSRFVAHDISHPFLVKCVLADLIKDLNLIVGGLLIVTSTFLNFKRYISIKSSITGKPNCAKVTPAKFLQNYIPVDQDFADMDRVVPSNFVICDSFILTLIRVCKKLIGW